MERHGCNRFARVGGVCALALVASAGRATAPPVFPQWMTVADLDGSNGYRVFGATPFGHAGTSVCPAGDFNEDGFDDFAIGSPDRSGSTVSPGEVRIVFGGPGVGGSGSLDLAVLDGVNGFAMRGITNADRTGLSVAYAGDVNGDGVGDVVIGAPYAAPEGRRRCGQSYVVFGGSGVGASGWIDLSLLDGTTGYVVRGVGAGDLTGFSVSSAGDFNADGMDDLVIGARGYWPEGTLTGKAYVVFGGLTVGATGVVALSDVNGSNGFVLNGIDERDSAGFKVASIGDVNADGVDDIIIGAPGGDPNGQSSAGESYVVFGGPGVGAAGSLDLSSLNGVNGFVINGVGASDGAVRVSGAGDMNGDGFQDIAIGAPGAMGHQPGAGAVYVVFGGPGVGASGVIELSDIGGGNGFAVYGDAQGDHVGSAVSGRGDINHDGFPDLLLGAPDRWNLDGVGITYVLFGGPATGYDGPVQLWRWHVGETSEGVIVQGSIGSGHLGASLCSLGDVDGDGVHDALLAAPDAFSNSRPQAGECYVLFGRAPVCVGDINGDGSTNVGDFAILAGNFSAAVVPSTGGDLNGDGLVTIADFNILAGDFGCGS